MSFATPGLASSAVATPGQHDTAAQHEAPTDDDGATSLIAAGLLQELLNSALLTAATASVWNWSQNSNRKVLRPAPADHMPPLPTFYPQVLAQLPLNPRLAACTIELRDYYDRLSYLHRLSLSTLAATEANEPTENRAEALADSWRRLAADAIAAISTLTPLVSLDIRRRLAEKSQTIVATLDQAANGEHPCVDRLGNVYVPFLMDRRRPRRPVFDVQVHLLVGGAIQGATVIDASEAGLGVTGVEGVEAGDTVDLVLDAENLISGRVVWTAHGRAGLEFFEPLPSELAVLFAFTNTDGYRG